MGDQYPSLALPWPQTPGPGLAAFRTSPSLDWVSPIAPIENMVRAMQYLFFSLDFSPIQSLNCTLGFYPLSRPPHCDLTVCLPKLHNIAWFRDWFVIGMRTFHEGRVMIRWLGPLGHVWAPVIMPLHYFVLDVVVSLGFCMFMSGQPMSFVCRYWFQTVGWRISNEKLKSGQFALMSTIRRCRDVKSTI